MLLGFVVSGFVMYRRGVVMLGGLVMLLRCVHMMLGCRMF